VVGKVGDAVLERVPLSRRIIPAPVQRCWSMQGACYVHSSHTSLVVNMEGVSQQDENWWIAKRSSQW